MTLLGTSTLTFRTAVGAAALLALAACSNGDSEAAPAAAPTTSDTSPSATSPTESASPSTKPSSEPSDDPTTPASEAPSTSAPPAPTPTAAPAQQAELIPYAGGESAGVTVHTRSQARRLTGAPAAFKRFVGDTAQHITDTADCDSAAKGVTVEAVRTDGYAVGGVNDCGGYAAIWAVVDGRWKEILGTQDSWECKLLKRYTVPSDIAGDTCYDYDAQQEHDYHQR